MPLIKSGAKSATSKNISEMVKSGFPQRQAVAASLSNARKYGAKFAEGGIARHAFEVARGIGDMVNKEVAQRRLRQDMSDSLAPARQKWQAKEATDISEAMGRTKGYAAGGASGPSYWEKGAARGLSRGTMLHSDVPGRTDKLPIKLPSGSYVVPADIVSGLGQGNSLAGTKALSSMIKDGKLRAPKIPKFKFGKMRRGGGLARGGPAPDVPIIAAGGEHIITPDEVRQIGHGDLEHGHNHLDQWVLDERKKNIGTLRKLKPPKKD